MNNTGSRYERIAAIAADSLANPGDIVLEKGVVLWDTLTKKALIQLKFKNNGGKRLRSLHYTYSTYDSEGNPITEDMDGEFKDINAPVGSFFGQQNPITVPSDLVRYIKIMLEKAVWEDFSVTDYNDEVAFQNGRDRRLEERLLYGCRDGVIDGIKIFFLTLIPSIVTYMCLNNNNIAAYGLGIAGLILIACYLGMVGIFSCALCWAPFLCGSRWSLYSIDIYTVVAMIIVKFLNDGFSGERWKKISWFPYLKNLVFSLLMVGSTYVKWIPYGGPDMVKFLVIKVTSTFIVTSVITTILKIRERNTGEIVTVDVNEIVSESEIADGNEIVCEHCGKVMIAGSKFCPRCGRPVNV